ncbi:MAG: sugar transferase [Candidatus Tritonobacter lacicola]|nr:sugar transferase [Candidatus Tritonobacter lacicola]
MKRHFLSTPVIVTLACFTDVILVILADLLSLSLRFGTEIDPRVIYTYFLILPFVIILRISLFYIFGLYDKPKYKTTYDIAINTFKATTISTLIIVVVLYFYRPHGTISEFPRVALPISWLLTMLFIISWRIAAKKLINILIGKDYFVSHLLIVGTDRRAQRLMIKLTKDTSIKYKLIGFIEASNAQFHQVNPSMILGNIEDIPWIIREYPIDEVVIASPDIPRDAVAEIFSYFQETDAIFKAVPDTYEAIIGRMTSSPGEPTPLVGLTSPTEMFRWYRGFKRILDIIIAVVALVIFFPLMLVIAATIRLTSPGIAIFRQRRAGTHGKAFTMYKFRSMYIASEEDSGPIWAGEDDLRITPLGRLLRKTRMDELPQFFNVLKNDMSVVGPRPERPHFVKQLVRQIPFYAERLEVKPGITGWAQVMYKYAASLEAHREKLLYDIFYIENMTPALDFLIILKTLFVVLRGRGAA